MDPHIKDEEEEPHDNSVGPPRVSLPESSLPDKEKKEVEIALSSIPTLPETALHDLETLRQLEADAEKALGNDQILKFEEIQREIISYTPSPLSDRYKGKVVHSAVQDAAKQIHDRLSREEWGRDPKVYVRISSGTHDPNFQTHALSSGENSWDPENHPGLLPHELQDESSIKPDIRYNGAYIWFQLQCLLDLGYAYINKATTPHSNAGNNLDSDRNIIIGYQLFFLAAMLNLEDSFSQTPKSLDLLYLIRDAEYATGTSEWVKDCLGRFDRDLTVEALRHKLKPDPEKKWERGPRKGLSLRQKAVKGKQERRQRKIAHRVEAGASGSGRAGHE
ncbi:hypothetical protein H0H93_002843 [Arthromyces matolae]|nr:hypothetical protein H0H93_002843 [Arthromyces matolae]